MPSLPGASVAARRAVVCIAYSDKRCNFNFYRTPIIGNINYERRSMWPALVVFDKDCFSFLEFGCLGCAREGDYIANVGHACYEEQQTFKSETETCVRN